MSLILAGRRTPGQNGIFSGQKLEQNFCYLVLTQLDHKHSNRVLDESPNHGHFEHSQGEEVPCCD